MSASIPSAGERSDPLAPYLIPLSPDPKNPAAKPFLIDFTRSPLATSYPNHFAMIIDECFSPTECKQLIELAESTTPEKWVPAKLNIGGGQEMLALSTRNCGRIMRDDIPTAETIFQRVMPWLVEAGVDEISRNGGTLGKWHRILAPINNLKKRDETRGERWGMVRYLRA